MIKILLVFLLLAKSAFAFNADFLKVGSALTNKREYMRIVGSSTLYPFVIVAAEEFGRNTKYHSPIVESTGTGGGMKIFCGGIGKNFPDIVNASRRIKDSEFELCGKNGIAATDIREIVIGYDGIIFGNSKAAPKYNFSDREIFLALASKIPQNGKLVENFHNKWSDISPNLPNIPIKVYGPPFTSGTRDSFVELVMEKYCIDLEEFKLTYPDKKERAKKCHSIRHDGKFIDSGENENIIISKILNDKNAFGIFGYGFYIKNSHNVNSSNINGFEPNFETISNGKYIIARPLFMYIKLPHLKLIGGIDEFIAEILSQDAVGKNGYLIKIGLIPLKEDEYAKYRL